MTGQKFKEIAKNGVLVNNPTFRLVLGTCPTLAISSSVFLSRCFHKLVSEKRYDIDKLDFNKS